jgi:GNAT superfamily N-acetyltransferase
MSEDNTINYVIRIARKTDIPEITRLNAQLGYPVDSDTVARRFRRLRKDRRNNAVFLACMLEAGPPTAAPGKSLGGWIHVFIDKLLTVGPRSEIGGLVVDEQWRGRGVGAALMRKAEQWVRSKGLTEVVVHSNVLRARAHEFYERCGYQLLKQSKVYTKEIR